MLISIWIHTYIPNTVPAGNNKYSENVAWMHLFDGMLLGLGQPSGLLWELQIEQCTNLLLGAPQQPPGSRGLPSHSPSSPVQRQTLHLQSQPLQSLNVLGCPKISDEGEEKKLLEFLRQCSICHTFAIIFLKCMGSLELSERTCIFINSCYCPIRQTTSMLI